MKWIIISLRRLCGLDDSDATDPFGSPGKNRIRVKVFAGAASIAGLAIVVVAILTSTFSSSVDHVTVPVDLTATPVSELVEGSSPLGSVLIHVVGEVAYPGMYELESGSRVIDAVMAAGGLSANASECGVNLARQVNDGEQISIPSQQLGCSPSGDTADAVVSVNQATAEQFDALPGIGPTLAERIIQWRESHGGFSSLEQLNDVSGIGDKLFAGIKELVTL